MRWAAIAPFAAFGSAVLLVYWAQDVIHAVFGRPTWFKSAQSAMQDWGVADGLIAVFFVFALELETWVALAAVTFCLGLTRRRRAHQFAWMLSIAVPFASLLLGTAFTIAMAGPRDWNLPLILQLFFLVPLSSTIVGLAAWWAGWLLRGRRGRGVPGACPACGYDLRGSVAAACPECGRTET